MAIEWNELRRRVGRVDWGLMLGLAVARMNCCSGFWMKRMLGCRGCSDGGIVGWAGAWMGGRSDGWMLRWTNAKVGGRWICGCLDGWVGGCAGE